MSVRFKFKNDLDYSAVPYDGFQLTVADVKKSIVRMKKLGRVTDFDLDVFNQQENKPYDNEDALIPKNSTLVIVRKPLPPGKQKVWEEERKTSLAVASGSTGFLVDKSKDQDMSEEDRIKEMASNSSEMFSQKHWAPAGSKRHPGSKPPPHYHCNRCHQPGHYKEDCPLTKSGYLGTELKKTTGIPRSFLKPADANTPGAKINPQG